MPHKALIQYQEQRLSASDAVQWIYSELSELDDGKRQLEKEIGELRIDLSMIVAEQPGMAIELPHVRAVISEPSLRISYDRKQIDEIIASVEYLDLPESSDDFGAIVAAIVNALIAARRETPVSGSLRLIPTRRK
jgi:regulator of replication initiation timing